MQKKFFTMIEESESTILSGITEFVLFFFQSRNIIISRSTTEAYSRFILKNIRSTLQKSIFAHPDADIAADKPLDDMNLFGLQETLFFHVEYDRYHDSYEEDSKWFGPSSIECIGISVPEKLPYPHDICCREIDRPAPEIEYPATDESKEEIEHTGKQYPSENTTDEDVGHDSKEGNHTEVVYDRNDTPRTGCQGHTDDIDEESWCISIGEDLPKWRIPEEYPECPSKREPETSIIDESKGRIEEDDPTDEK